MRRIWTFPLALALVAAVLAGGAGQAGGDDGGGHGQGGEEAERSHHLRPRTESAGSGMSIGWPVTGWR